jgi:hypothetical protein
VRLLVTEFVRWLVPARKKDAAGHEVLRSVIEPMRFARAWLAAWGASFCFSASHVSL